MRRIPILNDQTKTIRFIAIEDTRAIFFITPSMFVDTTRDTSQSVEYELPLEKHSDLTDSFIRNALTEGDANKYIFQTIIDHITNMLDGNRMPSPETPGETVFLEPISINRIVSTQQAAQIHKQKDRYADPTNEEDATQLYVPLLQEE